MLYTSSDPAGYWDDAPEADVCSVPRCGRDVEQGENGPSLTAYGNPACEEHRDKDWIVAICRHGEISEDDLECDPGGPVVCGVCGRRVHYKALLEYAKKQRG